MNYALKFDLSENILNSEIYLQTLNKSSKHILEISWIRIFVNSFLLLVLNYTQIVSDELKQSLMDLKEIVWSPGLPGRSH